MNNIDFYEIKKNILPYFISVYGEEYKDIIIEKMDKIELVFYNTIENQKNEMYRIKKTKRVELTLKFLEYNGIEIPEDIKKNVIMKNSTSYINDIPEAHNLLNACFKDNEYREIVWGGIKDISRESLNDETLKIQNIEILQKLGINVNNDNFDAWLNSDKMVQTLNKIEELQKYILSLNAEFKEVDDHFSDLKELIDKSEKIKRSINEKYMLEFLKIIKNYLKESDQQLLNEYIKSNQNKPDMGILKIIGNSFFDDGLIASFSSKAIQKLNDLDTPNYIRKNIIDNRIKYYELIGIYNEQLPPEEFILTEKAVCSAIKQEIADDIIAKKKHYGDLAYEEFLNITSTYQDNIKQIDSINWVDKPDFSINYIKKNTVCISPAIKKENDKLDIVAVLYFSKDGCLSEYIDTVFIHEINHAIELSLQSFNNNHPIYKSGFDVIDGDNERKYEAFSETLNQVIAMEITEAMHKDGLYLFDDPNTSKIHGGTSYEQQQILVDEFWDNFRKEIIAARVGNSLDDLFDVVGKENFEQLNLLINERKQLPYYQMVMNIISGEETELTKKNDEILNKLAKINDSMSNYAKKGNWFSSK